MRGTDLAPILMLPVPNLLVIAHGAAYARRSDSGVLAALSDQFPITCLLNATYTASVLLESI